MGLVTPVRETMTESAQAAALAALEQLQILFDRAKAAAQDGDLPDYHEALDQMSDRTLSMMAQAETTAGVWAPPPQSCPILEIELPDGYPGWMASLVGRIPCKIEDARDNG